MTAQDYLDARSKHRLTVDEFLLLDREGAFGDRRTELFDGEVYYMSPKHRPHARTVTQFVIALAKALEGSKLSVLTDISVRLSDHDVPEPDIAVTDAPEGDGILPLEAVKLLIEVADSTLPQDMGLKAALYAGAGVWAPRPEGYAERREVTLGSQVEAATVAGLAVETSDD